MNHVRFIILFVSTLFLGAGFILLKDLLSDRGERLQAPLGHATGLLGTSVQLVWAAMMIGWTMSEAHKPRVYLPLYGTPLGNSADILLFFAGLLTYVATAFYVLGEIVGIPAIPWLMRYVLGVCALKVRGAGHLLQSKHGVTGRSRANGLKSGVCRTAGPIPAAPGDLSLPIADAG